MIDIAKTSSPSSVAVNALELDAELLRVSLQQCPSVFGDEHDRPQHCLGDVAKDVRQEHQHDDRGDGHDDARQLCLGPRVVIDRGL